MWNGSLNWILGCLVFVFGLCSTATAWDGDDCPVPYAYYDCEVDNSDVCWNTQYGQIVCTGSANNDYFKAATYPVNGGDDKAFVWGIDKTDGYYGFFCCNSDDLDLGDLYIFAGNKNDTVDLNYWSNDITVYPWEEDAFIFGQIGPDELYGPEEDTGFTVRLYGGEDDDRLYGGDGVEHLYGGNGDDFIWGGDGEDYLHGQNDDDQLCGGPGVSHVDGGFGNNNCQDQNDIKSNCPVNAIQLPDGWCPWL